MKKSIRTILNLLLAAVFLFSITRFLIQQRENAAGESSYNNALALATSGKTAVTQPESLPHAQEDTSSAEPRWVVAQPEEDDSYIRELESMDLEALRQVNPDVVGWILIPDTVISYPILQGEDNDYYLKYTWDGKRYAMGSIFLEYQCSADFTDFNTLVYGHNMTNGSMFASLREYRNQEYWEKHPYVYIRSDQGVYRYEIFSSYLAKTTDNAYGIGFPSENARIRFLDDIQKDSAITTGIEPEITDRILTLSTCSGRGKTTRWVVHARLKMVPEEPA